MNNDNVDKPKARLPTVLYIAGSGRSGSTLLERLLGTLPRYVNVGEINDVFRRVAMFDELCGCGLRFSKCDFWQGVGRKAFGDWNQALVQEMQDLQRRVGRQRHLLLLLVPQLQPALYRTRLKRFRYVHARLYAAILEQADADVVVDASKGAAHAMAVSGGLDLRLVHLVRDARGVAFSWAKAGVERPHGDGPRAIMHSFRTEDTAARWTVLQAEIGAARRAVVQSTRVRYEDLVTDPAAELMRALGELHLPIDRAGLANVHGHCVDLPVSHGLSGNPSRFTSGMQTLRLDEQWRHDMSAWGRVSTTAIALLPLRRFGYLDKLHEPPHDDDDDAAAPRRRLGRAKPGNGPRPAD